MRGFLNVSSDLAHHPPPTPTNTPTLPELPGHRRARGHMREALSLHTDAVNTDPAPYLPPLPAAQSGGGACRLPVRAARSPSSAPAHGQEAERRLRSPPAPHDPGGFPNCRPCFQPGANPRAPNTHPNPSHGWPCCRGASSPGSPSPALQPVCT